MNKQELINYVVNSHVRNELDINELLRLIHLLPDELELNENQQVVLEWLKSVGKDMPIYRMADQLKWYIDHATTGEELDHALASLNGEEEFQVLAAFAEWGKEKVAE